MPQHLRVGFKRVSFLCFQPAGRVRFKKKKKSSSKVQECVNLKSEMYLPSFCFLNYNTSELIKAHQSLFMHSSEQRGEILIAKC